MGVFFGIAYFLVGIVQVFAIVDGVGYMWGIEGFFAFIIAVCTSYIPFLGAVLGAYGATQVWDWSLLQALLLFFWFIPIGLLTAVFRH